MAHWQPASLGKDFPVDNDISASIAGGNERKESKQPWCIQKIARSFNDNGCKVSNWHRQTPATEKKNVITTSAAQ